jgi:hypothetical protein
MAQLLSLNVGLPRDIEWKGKSVYGIALFLETSYDQKIGWARRRDALGAKRKRMLTLYFWLGALRALG